MINADLDGLTHINVYSKGKTSLGRMLSNFYEYRVNLSDGEFMSVESYWYWLGLSKESPRDCLRLLSGYKAKSKGNELKRIYGEVYIDKFEDKIMKAIWLKAQNHLYLFRDEYKDLPLEHYYVYDGKIKNVRNKYKWMIDRMTKMKDYIYYLRGS